jgi:serine/threonine-protein kinase
MVARPSRCDPNRLKLLLENRLAAHARADVECHLDHCDSCRLQLEGMAGDAQWWAEARQFLRPHADPSGSPGSLAVPPESPADPVEAPSPAHGRRRRPEFLEPSDNPAFLGRLGPYEIVEVIGQGGMGVVLKGWDANLHRYVAVKVLAPQLATSAAARQRFAREARAAAAVVHDHVVAIHAVDCAAGLPFLVMSYVGGTSLQERLDAGGALEAKEIVRIAMQIAEGLAAAHAQGLIHRDIKPANILLENGVERVKITDFGLARAADDASLTHSGYLAGTPHYMAPEQARGEYVDHRADLFSLGSVMYVMCTGQLPFRADGTLAVLRRIAEDAPRPMRQLNPDLPERLVQIVERLHAKHPDHRFQSAAEVAELLARYLAHLQQPALVPMPPQLPDRPLASGSQRQRAWRKAALGAALLTAVAGAAATAWLWPGGTAPPQPDDQETAQGSLQDRAAHQSAPAPASVLQAPFAQWDLLQEEIDRAKRQAEYVESHFRPSSQYAATPPPVDPAKIRAELERLQRELSSAGP